MIAQELVRAQKLQTKQLLQDSGVLNDPEDVIMLASIFVEATNQIEELFEGLQLKSIEKVAEVDVTGKKIKSLHRYIGRLVRLSRNDYSNDVAQIVDVTPENAVSDDGIVLVIAEKENVTLDEEGYATYIQNLISHHGYASEEALYKQYGYDDAAYGEAYLRQIYVDNLALEKIRETATVIEANSADTSTEGAGADSTEEALTGSDSTEE